MNRLNFSLLLAIGLFVLTGFVSAQSGGGAMSYHRIGSNARILGIGNAYTAGTRLGIYPQYNPAHASQATYNQIDMSAAVMSFDRNLASLSASFPLPPNAGLHISTVYAGVKHFDGRSPSGYPTGDYNTHDFQIAASFGLRINPKLSIGLTARFLNARYNPEIPAPTSFGADIGLLYSLNENTSIGFTIQDLLSEFTWDTQNLYNSAGSVQTTDKLPTRLKVGIERFIPSYNLSLFAETEHRVITSQVYESIRLSDQGRPLTRIQVGEENTTIQMVRLGAQWHAHERIDLRAGWQSGDLKAIRISQRISGGFTLKLPFDLYSPEIDYALMREPNGISRIHLFSLRLHVNKNN
jgi:hypothetical protein